MATATPGTCQRLSACSIKASTARGLRSSACAGGVRYNGIVSNRIIRAVLFSVWSPGPASKPLQDLPRYLLKLPKRAEFNQENWEKGWLVRWEARIAIPFLFTEHGTSKPGAPILPILNPGARCACISVRFSYIRQAGLRINPLRGRARRR